MIRRATCQCGSLVVECEGEPVRISVCHCLACQKRSGSPFAMQARFPTDRVRHFGEFREWVRVADSGHEATHHFCPQCGSTVWYRARPMRDFIAVPVGCFADPEFPPPQFSVYEERKHSWIEIPGETVEHHD